MNARIETDREVKYIKSQLTLRRAELANAKVVMAEKQRIVSALEKNIAALVQQLTAASTPTPDAVVVSEHAMLRYLERMKGLDTGALAQEIIGGSSMAIQFMGTGELRRDDMTLIIKNRTVVTVQTKG